MGNHTAVTLRQPGEFAGGLTTKGLRGVWIGTSGWTYDSWRGPFYPERLPKKDWLAWCAAQFPTTEINGSFYRTPSLQTVRGWREQTPKGFLFAWKASQFITHWKRLSNASGSSIELMATRLEELGPKAGPVLFQLPANFKANRERLASFLRMLPGAYRYAFEFRHPSWYEGPILDLLRDENAALCLSDHHEAPSPLLATADHVYVRAHGPGGFYAGAYSDEALSAWARRIRTWKRQRRTVYVYFDNDRNAAAPADALRLTAMVRAAPGAYSLITGTSLPRRAWAISTRRPWWVKNST